LADLTELDKTSGKPRSDCDLLLPYEGKKSTFLENYPCTGEGSDKSWNIGPCLGKSSRECCAKTCCELGEEQGGTTPETCIKQEPKEGKCGCKNIGRDEKGFDCSKETVQGVLESGYRTCNADDKPLGFGDCYKPKKNLNLNLAACCPKTCCELGKIDECQDEEKIDFEYTTEEVVSVASNIPQNKEVQMKSVKAPTNPEGTTVDPENVVSQEGTTVDPKNVVSQKGTTEGPSYFVSQEDTSNLVKENVAKVNANAVKVCELVQKELEKQEKKIAKAGEKIAKAKRFAKPATAGEFSKKHCATAPVFEKGNDDELVRIKGDGSIIQVTGSKMEDGAATGAEEFTVSLEMYLPKYKNGCSWVGDTETGKCEYVAA